MTSVFLLDGFIRRLAMLFYGPLMNKVYCYQIW